MNKLVFTIGKKDYPTDNYSYQLNKQIGTEKNTAEYISLSLAFIERNDLDSVMADGAFDCTLTVYNDAGGVIRQLAFEGAEIVGFSENGSAQSTQGYVNISLNAKTVAFDSHKITANSEVWSSVRGR